jgi:hypothetical protein
MKTLPMKTLPSPLVGVMRAVLWSMLAIVRWWEDRNANRLDYRMTELNAGLWRASQSLKALAEGEFKPPPRPARVRPVPLRHTPRLPEPMPVRARVAYREQRDSLLDAVPRPGRSAD